MFDLNDESFINGDRRAIYAQLRAETPVLKLPDGDGPPTWILSRYQDVQALLRLPNGRVHPLGLDAPSWMPEGPALQRLRANLSQVDAPVHSRLRSVLNPFFIPRRLEALRATAAASVARALQRMADHPGEEIEVVHDIAAQVPKGVICHMLGIPEADWEKLIEVQYDFLMIFSLTPLPPAQQKRLDEVTAFYLDYFENALQHSDPASRSPFIELLLAAQQRGELSRIEVLSIMHTVLDAGYETTRASISNAMELLATIPGLHEQLRADPANITPVLEEILRYHTPVQIRFRHLVEPFTASDGTVIPAGALVLGLIASANQDETVFGNPGTFDFKRSNVSQHLAFGGGMHHCLGGPMARIQVQETLRGLAATFKGFELTRGPGPRFPMAVFPALSSLHVTARQ